MHQAVTQLQVEIPEIPKPTHRSFGLEIDLMGTIKAMQPGASFIVDSERSRDYALIIGGRKGIPITTRKEGSRYRIWRKP